MGFDKMNDFDYNYYYAERDGSRLLKKKKNSYFDYEDEDQDDYFSDFDE